MAKTILVRYFDPYEVTDMSMEDFLRDFSEEEFKRTCFRVYEYPNEGAALWAYAESPCTWSRLLDDSADAEEFIDEATTHLKSFDFDWLEKNFV